MALAESPSMSEMTSPERMPAFAAGVSSIAVTILISPFSCVISMPMPPNLPAVFA
jgi:hypothetical protein